MDIVSLVVENCACGASKTVTIADPDVHPTSIASENEIRS